MGCKNAQAAIEFISFFGFFALVFLMISISIAERQEMDVKEGRWSLAREMCLALKADIDNAFELGDGYWRISGGMADAREGYTARVKDGWVSVELSEGTSFTAALETKNVTGESDIMGVIIPDKGQYFIRNNGGMIEISRQGNGWNEAKSG